ncbi:MAG TPA: hypothetical protein VIW78_15435 [Burkholderiales bacterium]
MKTCRLELWALLFVSAFFPAVTQAQSVFRPYLGLAPTSYSISFDNNAPPGYAGKTAKSNYVAGNLGLTWISPKGIYVDLSGQLSGPNATHDLWQDSTVSQPQDFTHDSYTLTGGYSHGFESGASVSGFGGYTYEKTTLAAPRGATVPSSAGPLVINFSKDTFESSGIFIGAGGGYPALAGQFSGSVAVAGMKGTWKDDNGFNNSATTTVGFSLGGAYTYPITQSLGITADLRFQQYKYDFGAANTPTAYTVTEKITSLGVKLGYRF